MILEYDNCLLIIDKKDKTFYHSKDMELKIEGYEKIKRPEWCLMLDLKCLFEDRYIPIDEAIK